MYFSQDSIYIKNLAIYTRGHSSVGGKIIIIENPALAPPPSGWLDKKPKKVEKVAHRRSVIIITYSVSVTILTS